MTRLTHDCRPDAIRGRIVPTGPEPDAAVDLLPWMHEHHPSAIEKLLSLWMWGRFALPEWTLEWKFGAWYWGRVRFDKQQIILNTALRECGVERETTLLHELAHVWTIYDHYLEDGSRTHGPLWKAKARALGCPPRYGKKGCEATTRAFVAARLARSRVVAVCPACQREFRGLRRLARTRRWLCEKCRVEVRMVE